MKLYCKHDYQEHGFSYIKCEKCGKVKYNPKENNRLRNITINKYVASGAWSKKEADNLKSRIEAR